MHEVLYGPDLNRRGLLTPITPKIIFSKAFLREGFFYRLFTFVDNLKINPIVKRCI